MLYYGLSVNSKIKHKENNQYFSNRLLHRLTFYNGNFVDDFSKTLNTIKKTQKSYDDKNNKSCFFKARVDFILKYLLGNRKTLPNYIYKYPFIEDKKKSQYPKDEIYLQRLKLLYNQEDIDVANEKIKTTFIYFIHIDNFKINNNMYVDNVTDGKIRSSQNIVDVQKVNRYIKESIENFSNVIVSVIGTFDKKNRKYYIQFDLDDGNHRLTSLKMKDYDGYVPVLFVDELSNFDTMNKYDIEVRNIDNRIFKNGNETSNTISSLT